MAIYFSDANKQLSEFLGFNIGKFEINQIDIGKDTIFCSASEPPTFTGEHTAFGDGKKGYMQILSDGVLTFNSKTNVQAFLVGGGSAGKKGTSNQGGKGGNGGEITTINKGYNKGNTIRITIGKESASKSTEFDGTSVVNGGGKSGGNGAKLGFPPIKAQAGQKGVQPFNGDVSPFSTMPFYGASGGGSGIDFSGGESGGAGGETGGGKGADYKHDSKGIKGETNTGSGGGAASNARNSTVGSGGSGIIIVRWGNWSTGM